MFLFLLASQNVYVYEKKRRDLEREDVGKSWFLTDAIWSNKYTESNEPKASLWKRHIMYVYNFIKVWCGGAFVSACKVLQICAISINILKKN